MRKKFEPIFFVMLVIFATITLIPESHAAGAEAPAVHLRINSIKETPNGFVINGSVIADGPHDRVGIYDEYYLWVDIIIKNGSNARYPNFKEWAYEPESIAYYYPDAETRYVPGSGPGGTMTKEEAYGVNVTTINLFSAGDIGNYNFERVVPLEYAGKQFRIQATLNWDFRGAAAYWWAHRYVNDIGGEGVLGENFEFLYSEGVKVKYPDGSVDEKFSWKANWPTDGTIHFEFTKDNSYLALWGGSLRGDSSVSGEITKDKIVIRKNLSDIPLEFVSLQGQYLVAGEGEVSIVPEIRDENGSLILKGWGNLTDEMSPEKWNNETAWIKDLTIKMGNYIWGHKFEIAGGIFIKVVTGVPGFVFTAPTKYVAKALGYLSVPPSEGQVQQFRDALNAYDQSCKSYGNIKHGCGGVVHYCRLYVMANESGMSVYLVDGKATLEGKNESMNITGGEFATILSNGSITSPQDFDEEEVKEKTGLTMDTLWIAKEIELKDYAICKKLDENEKPLKETTNFSTKDTVYVWLDLGNASNDDKIKWVFEGPNNITEELNYTLNWSGNGYCYAWLSMNHYGKDGIGQWKVTTYINGEKAMDAYFDVKATKTDMPGFELLAIISAFMFLIWRRKK